MGVSRHGVAWLGLALLAAAPVRAQEDACRRRSLMASVIDAKGNPVPGLGREDFSARFRGKPVNITFAELDTHTRRIVILLDASPSMLEPSGKWRLALDATEDFATNAPPGFALALLVFAEKVEARIAFAQGRPVIEEKLASLKTRGKVFAKRGWQTALWDAVLQSLGEFSTPHLGDVIYVITDGGDNKSNSKPAQAESALFAAGARLFVFIPPEDFIPDDSLGPPEDMANIAKATGGNILSLVPLGLWERSLAMQPDADVLAEQTYAIQHTKDLSREHLDALYRQMAVFYRLDVELPQAVDKPRDWSLKLEAPGKNKKGWSLVYPRKLMPCAAR